MNTFTLTFALAIALTAGSATTVAATTGQAHDMSAHPAQQAAAAHQGFGVVKKIDDDAAKVQIAHEPIPSLQWPAMTMWFALRQPVPGDVKAGDRVRFEMEQTPSKAWAITRIERSR